MSKKWLYLFAILGILVIEGCGSGMQQMPSGDKLNPAMSATMKNAKLHGHAKSAQN